MRVAIVIMIGAVVTAAASACGGSSSSPSTAASSAVSSGGAKVEVTTMQVPGLGTVLVNAQGQYVVNRRPVPFRSVDELAEELRRAAGGANQPMVVISADANATHQAVIRVMEAARLAGLSQITFTTQSAK